MPTSETISPIVTLRVWGMLVGQTPELGLETPRLWLRLMQPDDGESLLAIFADAKVMAAFDAPPFDHANMQQWVERNLEHQTTYGYGLFSVFLKTNRLLIGNCGLERMEVEGLQVAELGYDFRSEYWNQGYATEAARAVRDCAFGQLQLPRLVSLIRVGNMPSRRVAEKIGMRCTAEITRDGRPYWHYLLERETRDD
jgi:RimJ/RimL family protein N-acetyltransferase